MEKNFSENAYNELISKLFVRFPSFQKIGSGAYKPGIESMKIFDSLTGHPHRKYKIIHVAGTNGKGSVSNMLASCLAAMGMNVGLYTSPHILDFRERIRTIRPHGNSTSVDLISKEFIWSFVTQWQDSFDHLNMSFFEITTALAFSWFAKQEVDIVVLETGLGGRLDSTNIICPIMSVITNIGLDHCDMLGDTLPEIAFEKAGIIKAKTPVIVGESCIETDLVFERKVLYTNLPEAEYMGNRSEIMSLLTFADKLEVPLWEKHEEILKKMDLQGEYQRKNLRTALAALDVYSALSGNPLTDIEDAIIHTASRTDFHGRWEKVSDEPCIICDIGHNEHGLKYNFAQLESMKSEGSYTDLIIVYGSVADKDVDAVVHLMPSEAEYVFTQAHGKRALPAEVVRDKYQAVHGPSDRLHCVPTVIDAMTLAYELASSKKQPLIYVGGSTYVVSEAVEFFQMK